MRTDNAQAGAESQSGSLAAWFGGEERVEHAFANFGRNAAACVGNGDSEISPGGQCDIRKRLIGIKVHCVGMNAKGSFICNRVTGVNRKVHHDLADLSLVAHHRGQVGLDFGFQFDKRRQCVPQDRDHVRNNLIDMQSNVLSFAATSEGQ